MKGTLQYPLYFESSTDSYQWSNHEHGNDCLCFIDENTHTSIRGIKYEKSDARTWDLYGQYSNPITMETADQY